MPTVTVPASLNRHDRLQGIVAPRSIAIVGASPDRSKGPGRWLAHLIQYGYGGKLYPVNPRHSEVAGLPSYPSLEAIDAPVDLAILLTPAGAVPGVLEGGMHAGIRHFIVYAGGFAEVGGAGADMQARIRALACRHGASVLGPNCVGVINSRLRMCATSSSVAQDLAMRPGGFSFVAQSGAMASYWLDQMDQSGLGFAKWITTGNEADITMADAVAHLAEDDETRIIGIYVESARNGLRLKEALELAAAAGKPVLALRAGRSGAGADAAASHTAAVAAPDAVWRGLFDQTGVAAFDSLTALVDAGKMLTRWPEGTARRPALVSVSGGAVALLTDAVVDAGFELQDFAPEVKAGLARVLPPFATPRNPLDTTAALTARPEMLGDLGEVLASDDLHDCTIVVLGLLHRNAPRFIAGLRDRFASQGRPVAVVWQCARPDVVAGVEAAGMSCFGDIPAAVQALAAYGRLRHRAMQPHPQVQPGQRPLPRARPGHYVTEAAGRALLPEAALLAGPRAILVRSVGAVPAALRTLQLPLVAKLQSPAMPHKTEHGGIRLGLAGQDAVVAAVSALLELADAKGLPCEGVLLQEMVHYPFELLLGLREDPMFGPILVVGKGGTDVEVDPDIAVRLLPVSPAMVADALRQLRISRRMSGLRGATPVDLDRLAGCIAGLADLYAQRPELVEIEMNPVAVSAPDRFVALDLLLTIADEPAVVSHGRP